MQGPQNHSSLPAKYLKVQLLNTIYFLKAVFTLLTVIEVYGTYQLNMILFDLAEGFIDYRFCFRMRQNGRKTFILTNSGYSYTEVSNSMC